MKEFQQHKFLICLDSPLYLAVVKFQAEHELGRSYAALRIFIEGLKSLNLISQELYEYYRRKYSEPLKPDFILEDKRVKCDFCGQPAVARAVHESGVVKHVCSRHLAELQGHPKWRVEG
jgi:hypothetical protein